MICKHCGAFLEEGVTLCPVCGEKQTEDIPEIQTEEPCACEEAPVQEIPAEEAPAGDIPGEEVPAEEAQKEAVVWAIPPEPEKKRILPIILAAAGCVVLLGVLVFALLRGMGVTIKLPKNDIFRKNVYMVEEADAKKASDTVVATVGDLKLTNGELQIYFWSQVYDFLDYNGLSYFDPYTPLSEQITDASTGKTWEQYFLEIALQTWQRYATLRHMADEAGFTPSEDMKTYLEGLPQQMADIAEEYGLADADALIMNDMGPAASFESYLAYMETYCVGLDYFDVLYEEMTPSAEEIEAYFTANAETLAASGITKESGLKSDVRHILIMPRGGTIEEDGSTTYSEEEWAATLATAEEILAQWKAGDATEESFTALAQEHSDDPGVVSNSGLYQSITSTAGYLEEFRAWAVDSSRKAGDTGIVKTTAGYHIMYFVSGEENWIVTCRNSLVSEKVSAAIDAATEKTPMKVSYERLVLGNALADEIAERNAAATETAPPVSDK